MMAGAIREKEYVLESGSTPAVLAGDLEDISVQFQGISGDDLSIQISNAEGEQAAIQAGDWDNAGVAITADDTVKLTTGAKWMRVTKNSGATAVTVRIYGSIKIR
jgi:hypothetical protein